MNKIFFFILSLTLLSCMQPLEKTTSTQNYVVRGTINGEFDDYIKIKYKDQLDSAQVVNNAFLFKGTVTTPTAFRFRFDSVTSSEVFYLENDTLFFDIIVDDLKLEDEMFKDFVVNQLSGGKTVELKAYLTEFLKSTSKSKRNRDLILDKMDSLIKAHPNHDYLGKILSEISMNQTLLYNDIKSLVSKLDVDKLNPQDVEILEKYQHKRRKYQIGSQIPSFDLISITADTVDLKSDFAKYNLIQFWYSWCETCKNQQEELLKVYQDYNFKGFEIVSVSLDTTREDWINSVSEQSLPWKSLRVKNGFTGELPTELGITDLPQYYLVDKSGRIIEINLSIDELDTILSALLN